MPKSKESTPIDATLRAPALALRAFEKEVEKAVTGNSNLLAQQDLVQLSSIHSYTILLFLADFATSDLTEKQFSTLLARYEVDTPGNRKIYPNLSQSALFEIFGNIGVSRETIRRLLILMAEHGLVDRISKGPPFPDQLAVSKNGARLINKVGKRLTKEMGKEKAFAYL